MIMLPPVAAPAGAAVVAASTPPRRRRPPPRWLPSGRVDVETRPLHCLRRTILRPLLFPWTPADRSRFLPMSAAPTSVFPARARPPGETLNQIHTGCYYRCAPFLTLRGQGLHPHVQRMPGSRTRERTKGSPRAVGRPARPARARQRRTATPPQQGCRHRTGRRRPPDRPLRPLGAATRPRPPGPPVGEAKLFLEGSSEIPRASRRASISCAPAVESSMVRCTQGVTSLSLSVSLQDS